LKEHQRVWRSAIFVGVLSLVAAACGPTATPPGASPTTGTSPTAAATPAPVAGGRIIEGSISDIRTMNTILVSDTPSGRITSLIYDGLITADKDNGEPKPNMATFEVGSDGKTYTFTIDAKANWSDGKPVIAEDWYVAKKLVALSKVTVRKSLFADIVGWKEFLPASETNPTGGTATEISGVKIDPANPKKFTVTTATVSCPALFNLASYVLPAHVFGKYAVQSQADAIDKAPENNAPTVFSGPFKFKEWRQGDQVILTRNDTYWRGAPLVEEYVYKVVADQTVLTAQLKTGELNFGTTEPKDLADMQRQENLKVTKYPNLGYTYIGWRTDSQSVPAFADKRVRQALAYGLDMDTVIKSVLFGEGFKQVSHHVPVQWAYPDPKTLNQYPYDKAKAESLLQEAGFAKGADGIYAKDGKPISFTIRTNAGNKTRETLAQVASEQYKAIGIDAKTNFEAFQGLVTQLTEGHPTIEAVIIGWALGTEPDPYSIWHSSQIPDPATKRTGFGFTAFKSDAVDKAIVDARNPANGDCSVATRKGHYATMNKILNEEQPYNFGFGNNILSVTNVTMQNYDPGAFSTIWNVEKWWFKK
jgi:peptide/nickel transport system substrate-binding protein